MLFNQILFGANIIRILTAAEGIVRMSNAEE